MLVFLGLLAITSAAHCQVLLITVGGTWNYQGQGEFSDIPAGTPFTFTETFDISRAVQVNTIGSTVYYTDPAGTSSITTGASVLSGVGPEIAVSSNSDPADPYYGYEFSQTLSGGGYAVQILSGNSSVAPDTTLLNLKTFPFVNFMNAANLAAVNLSPSLLSGNNNSFTVQVESVPEPSALSLAMLALVAFVALLYRKRRASLLA